MPLGPFQTPGSLTQSCMRTSLILRGLDVLALLKKGIVEFPGAAMAHLGLKDAEEAATAIEKDRAEHTTGKLGAILASQTFSGKLLLSILTRLSRLISVDESIGNTPTNASWRVWGCKVGLGWAAGVFRLFFAE